MNIEWVDVTGSDRIVAMAYGAKDAAIFVRFTDGVEWRYENCSQEEYEQFSDSSQSKGKYIHHILNKKPHSKLVY